MSTLRQTLVLVSVLQQAPFAGAPARAAEKPAAAAESWRWVSNPRFEVLTNGPERRARKVIEELESFRAAISQMMGGQVVDPPQPVRVLLFDRVWDFTPYQVLDAQGKPETWDGYTMIRGDQTWFALSNESDDAVPRLVLSGYAYRLIAEQFRSQPDWLRTGLTEYLSAYRYIERDRRAEIGRPIPQHMQYLNASTHATVRQVVTMTHDSPEFARDVPRALFFAKSWLLVHYLQIGSAERAGTLARFAQLRAQGVADVEALERAAGCSLVELDQELSVYQRKSLMSFATLALEPPRPERIETRPAETADALVRLGEYLQAVAPERRAEAVAHFTAAGRPAPAAESRVADLTFTPAPATPRVTAPPAPPADTRSLAELRAEVAAGGASARTRAAYAREVQQAATRDWESIKTDVPVARRALREVILETPHDESLWYLLNWLYTAESAPADRAEGISTYLRGIEAARELRSIPNGLVELLGTEGDNDRARAELEAALARDAAGQAALFEQILVELDATAAARLARDGDRAAGLRLLESRLASVSAANRQLAEARLSVYRADWERKRVGEQYQAAVDLVNAQKVEAGAKALREFLAAHPDSPYSEQAREDLAKVEEYLERRRARQEPRPLPPPPPPPPPPA